MQRASLTLGLLLLSLAGPVSADPADPVAGSWTLTGRNTRDGVYHGTMAVTRAERGYSIDVRVRLGNGKDDAWSGTGSWANGTLSGNLTRSGSGIVDNLRDPRNPYTETLAARWNLSRSGERLAGSWKSSLDGIRSREWLRREAPAVAIDMALIRPDGSELAEAVEDTEGEAIAVNLDDDDGDGGSGGHAQTEVTPDFDDANATAGENDLLRLEVKKVAGAPAGATLRLEYPADRIGVYRGSDRSGRSQDGVLTLPSTEATTLWVEGRGATEGEAGAMLVLSLRAGDRVCGEDRVKLHVAQSGFLLLGHGNSGRWALDDYARKHAKDQRREPTIVAGKDREGKRAFWAIYVSKSEKQAKLALSTPGSVVAYDGHSNFGMGFAFETHHARISEFMNIANEQIPVNWIYMREHQEHPALVFEDSEYGDDSGTPAFSDPVQVPTSVRGTNGSYETSRFPSNPGSGGRRFTITRGTKKWDDQHYSLGADNVRIVVKAGAADMPTRNWRALFLNSCYSGPYYYDVFNHGTLFFTTDSASSGRTSAAFLIGYIEGKKDAEVLKDLNAHENVNDYVQFGQE